MSISFSQISQTVSTTELDLVSGSAYAGALSQTTTGWLEWVVDLSALAAGDKYALRLYVAKDATPNPTLVDEFIAEGAQSQNWTIGPHIIGQAWTITAKKLAGTSRSIGLAYSRDDGGAGGSSSSSYKPSHPVHIFKQSEATASRRRFWFTFYSSTGARSTGIAASLGGKISKNGATPAALTGTWTEVDATNFPGVYYYEAAATELNTLGTVVVVAGPDGTVGTLQECHGMVLAADLFDGVRAGLTALPNAAANAAGGLFSRGTGAGQINQDANGRIDINLAAWKGTAPVALDAGGYVGADVNAWLGTAPSALSAAGNVKADVEEWRATVPAILDSTFVQTNVNHWLGTAPNVLVSGRVDASVGAVAAGAITRAAYAQDAKDMLREVGRDTAAAGAAGTITLGASAAATANIYNDHVVAIVSGTGAGQARRITAYTVAKVASVVPNWTTNPDATSVYELYYDAGADVRTWGGSTAAPTTVNALVSGRVDSSTGAMAANVVTASAIAASALTSAKFDNSVNIQVARNGTAQVGSTSTTIKLDAGASVVDNYYNELICYIVSGTGAGQSRQVTGYVGSTKVATIDAAWSTTPDGTSVFQLLPTAAGGVSGTVNANVTQWGGGSVLAPVVAGVPRIDVTYWHGGAVPVPNVTGVPEVDVVDWQGVAPNVLASGRVDSTIGSVQAAAIARAGFAQDTLDLLGDVRRNTAQGGTTTTITLDATAAGADNRYKNGLILIVGGTGVGQFRQISSYVGATKIATVDRAWDIVPDATSVFQILAAGGSVDSTAVANAVWDEPRTSHTTGGSFGEGTNVVSIAAAAANTVRDAVLNYSLRTGRTIKGALRRMDALVAGKATGMLNSIATFFQPDGSTVEFTAAQDTSAGTRATADVTNSES